MHSNFPSGRGDYCSQRLAEVRWRSASHIHHLPHSRMCAVTSFWPLGGHSRDSKRTPSAIWRERTGARIADIANSKPDAASSMSVALWTSDKSNEPWQLSPRKWPFLYRSRMHFVVFQGQDTTHCGVYEQNTRGMAS